MFSKPGVLPRASALQPNHRMLQAALLPRPVSDVGKPRPRRALRAAGTERVDARPASAILVDEDALLESDIERLGDQVAKVFDPYPFILLNLVLSCLAAIQAPIIMMSQKRQEAKDRLRSENDYRVNLKAEFEIRHLHEKLDHLINRQWERLAEIQQIQLEIMEDLPSRKG